MIFVYGETCSRCWILIKVNKMQPRPDTRVNSEPRANETETSECGNNNQFRFSSRRLFYQLRLICQFSWTVKIPFVLYISGSDSHARWTTVNAWFLRWNKENNSCLVSDPCCTLSLFLIVVNPATVIVLPKPDKRIKFRDFSAPIGCKIYENNYIKLSCFNIKT